MAGEMEGVAQVCPGCGVTVDAQTVVCTDCGHNFKYGMNTKTIESAKGVGSVGIGLVMGAVVAVVGGLLWAVIGHKLNLEIGWLAWGIGLAVGFAVFAGCRRKGSFLTGALAAVMAIGGICLGKVLMVEWSYSVSDAVSVIMKSNEEEQQWAVLTGLYITDRDSAGYSEEKQELLDRIFFTEESTDQDLDKAGSELMVLQAKAGKLTDADKRKMMGNAVEDYIRRISYTEKIGDTLGGMDLLFFGLAVFTAFKLGAGIKDSD